MTLKVLHIFKSEPDETVKRLMEGSSDDDVTTISLVGDEVDWLDLVDQLFAHDKVICWW